ncbi:uncharacterized protein LOC119690180 [Teleopsis dalmanni]|uniref:uncharacterized protein LOC119690180 n=1 Tax=Teleopsis dalmanni TaxID=139649 RepID=UPI000D32B5AC|nr:uncharacterized protein LOC119690180 [Teleopsis dalmanni]
MFVQYILILLLSHFLISVTPLECYTCDSAEDTECATSPGQQISVEECSSDLDECVTVIVAGITRRGCLLKLFPNKYCPEPCDRCNYSLCNRNIFPLERLQCYQCVGAECINVSGKKNLMYPCPLYDSTNRCYTNIIGLSNVQRGCAQADASISCSSVCAKCNYNGCNNESVISEETCFECSHTLNNPNPNCLRQFEYISGSTQCSIQNVTRCKNKLMSGHIGQCYLYQNEQTGVVQRGCSSNKPLFTNGNLIECTGKDCNKECITISCNNCTTNENNNCRTSKFLTKQKCAPSTFSCFSCEKDLSLRRGCSEEDENSDTAEVCYKCSQTDGCNNESVRTCYHCSSQLQPECANEPTLPAIDKRKCAFNDELCVSVVMSKMNYLYVVRDCASQVPECTENNPFCVSCNGTLCNNKPILIS